MEAGFPDRSVWNSLCISWVAGAVWGSWQVGCVCEGGVWTPMGYRKYGWAGLKGSAIRTFYTSAWRVASQLDLCLVRACEMVQPDICLTLKVKRKFANWGEWIRYRCCRLWACPGLLVFLARQAVIRGWWRLPVSGDELSAFLGAGSFPRGKKGARLWKGPIIGGSVSQNDCLWVKYVL